MQPPERQAGQSLARHSGDWTSARPTAWQRAALIRLCAQRGDSRHSATAFLTPTEVDFWREDRSAMSRYGLSTAIVTLLLSASALAAEPKQPPGTQPMELRVTVQTPPGSIHNDDLDLFSKRVETATEGAL